MQLIPSSSIIKLRKVSLALLFGHIFCAEVTLQGRLTTSHDHITIGCGFPRSRGANLSKARTGIFSCLNLKRSSAKLVLPEEMEWKGRVTHHSTKSASFKELSDTQSLLKLVFFSLKTTAKRYYLPYGFPSYTLGDDLIKNFNLFHSVLLKLTYNYMRNNTIYIHILFKYN